MVWFFFIEMTKPNQTPVPSSFSEDGCAGRAERAGPGNRSGPWTASAWTETCRVQSSQLLPGHAATVERKKGAVGISVKNNLRPNFDSKLKRKSTTYSHGSFERARQDVVHWQLRVVAPHLGRTHALGRWDKEAIFCSSRSASRNVLMVAIGTFYWDIFINAFLVSNIKLIWLSACFISM